MPPTFAAATESYNKRQDWALFDLGQEHRNIVHNQCDCLERENQLPIPYVEARSGTQGCRGEEMAREVRVRVNPLSQQHGAPLTHAARHNLRSHRGCGSDVPEITFNHSAPVLPLRQLSMCIGVFPWPVGFLQGIKSYTGAGGLLQDGICSSLKDSGTALQPFRGGVIF